MLSLIVIQIFEFTSPIFLNDSLILRPLVHLQISLIPIIMYFSYPLYFFSCYGMLGHELNSVIGVNVSLVKREFGANPKRTRRCKEGMTFISTEE